MAEYETPSGQVVLIDEDDLARLGGRKISIGSHGYAQIWDPATARVLLLHRWIMGAVDKTGHAFLIDHEDRNPMNCRRSNLRVVTPTESNLNRAIAERPLPRNVYLSKGKYQARVKRHRRIHHLGTFDTPEAADAAVRRAFPIGFV